MATETWLRTLLIEAHRAIEESASSAVEKLAAGRVHMSYPPNAGLSPSEAGALTSLKLNPDQISGLRKIMADVASYPLFQVFCLIDGVTDPVQHSGKWPALRLEAAGAKARAESSMLHDEFFGTYWDWRKIRPETGWKLDSL